MSGWAPRTGAIFPSVGICERIDTTIAALLEGRVAILTEGSPVALMVPNVFSQLFHAPDDYYSRPFNANLERFVRF